MRLIWCLRLWGFVWLIAVLLWLVSDVVVCFLLLVVDCAGGCWGVTVVVLD